MGNKSSKKQITPKTMEELRSHIDVEFSSEEIQDWYKDFRKDLRHGETELDKTAFIKVYNSLFSGDASEFAEQVFRTFDRDGNHSVDFKEFILGLCLSGSENAEKKLKWAFNMYDIDQNGYITKEEMAHIFKAICKMTGKVPQEFKSPEDMAEKIFKMLDKNSDSAISQQEFIEGADKVSLEIPCNYSSLLDLPEELVIMVLSYIPVSELLYTVCKICRGLKDVVRKMQSLWTIVEFDDSYTIDIAMMEMIVKNNQLVCLNLSNQNITFGSHRFTKLMLKLTPTIQELYVAETPLNNLAFVMSLRNLTTLDISGTSINDNQVVILSHASQLRHLYISFTKVTAATIADLSRNFKFLVIFDACQIYFMFTDICLIVSSCEQLRFLHVSFFSQFDIDQAVQYVNQQLSIERQLKLTVF